MNGEITNVLVIGATGRTGRHLVSGLLDRGRTVRALVRTPRTADLPGRVRMTEGALEDQRALREAATGADAAFLLWPYAGDLRPETVVTTLTGAGVQHLVYLSAASVDGGVMEGIYAEVEQAIDASGLSRTFVRPGGFAANTLEWAEQIRTGDVVSMPFPDAGRALIDERDIAEVATAGLLDPSWSGTAVAISGPQTLTMHQQVEVIGDVLGRDLRVQTQPRSVALSFYTERMGAEFAARALGYWESLVDHPEPVLDGVERVLGRAPRPLADWAQLHREDFSPGAAGRD